MMVEQSITAELTHHQWLLILRLPLKSISLLRQAIVPANILVTPEHVQILTKRIVDHLRPGVSVVTLHCRREQTRRIETARVRDQVTQKGETRIAERRFIRD